jgi:hypothetical protein
MVVVVIKDKVEIMLLVNDEIQIMMKIVNNVNVVFVKRQVIHGVIVLH